MGKKLDQDTINFEPADYDYLDNIPLPEWIEEFLKRNVQFQKDYKKLCKLAKAYKKESSNIFFSFWKDMYERYGVWALPKPIPFYPDVKLKKYKFIALQHEPVKIHENVAPNVWSHLRPDGTRDDRIMISIYLHYTQKEIIDKLRPILKHRHKSNVRSEWKYYLMVWDLKKAYPKITYNQISSILSQYENLPTPINDMRSVENYYKKADKLIHSGYKSFL